MKRDCEFLEVINDDCNYNYSTCWIHQNEDEKTELSLPLKFLLWSSRVLSAAGTCKPSSRTSDPPLSHTDSPGSLDSNW